MSSWRERSRRAAFGPHNGVHQPPPAVGHALERDGDLEQQKTENRPNRAVGCTLCCAAWKRHSGEIVLRDVPEFFADDAPEHLLKRLSLDMLT
jgi:hypothetical protein